MPAPPNMLMNLAGRNAAGALQTAVALSSMSTPARTLGLGGDSLSVVVAAEDWPTDGPVGWDLSKPMRVTFGDADTSVSLDGYRLTRAIDAVRGAPVDESAPGTPAPHTAKLISLDLVTEPGFWRDGRGGTLREGVLNRLSADGTVDDSHADYTLNSALINLCLAAMGFPAATVPASADTFGPPGPLDWDNAPALNELEALLARIGHEAAYANDGSAISIVELAKAGEAITLPTEISDHAEDYDLYSAPPVRGRTVVVTSGPTRAAVVTSRHLGSTNALEWVWYDERTGRWLNDAETASLYPSERQPGTIGDYRAGPGETADSQQQFSRVFSAVRINASEIESVGRFLSLREPVSFGGESISGPVAFVEAIGVVPAAGGTQLVNDPVDISGGQRVRLTGARVSPEHGVIELPPQMEYVYMGSATGGRGDTDVLAGDELKVTFAHEARTGTFTTDFFVAGYSWDDGTGTLTEITGSALTDAIDDPDTLRVEAPFLRLVYTNDDGTSVYTEVNRSALEAIAEELAAARLASSMATSGVIELAGLRDVSPGAVSGAVSRVEWDLAARRTVLRINQHEVAGSSIEALKLDAGRSFASGLAGLDAPPTAVDAVSARSLVPREAGGIAITVAAGAEAASAPRTLAAPHRDVSAGSQIISAEITGNDDTLGDNRWWYDWKQVSIGVSGSVTDVANGLTSAADGRAINPAEISNTGTGVEGDGIDHDELPDGFEMQPIATGRVVQLLGPVTDGTDSIWVMVGGPTNSVDGECS